MVSTLRQWRMSNRVKKRIHLTATELIVLTERSLQLQAQTNLISILCGPSSPRFREQNNDHYFL